MVREVSGGFQGVPGLQLAMHLGDNHDDDDVDGPLTYDV